MDFVGIALGSSAVAVVVVVAVVGLFVVRSINRSSKGSSTTTQHVYSDGKTHGDYFDQAESFGQEFIAAGLLDEPTWQPFFEAIAKKLTTHKAKAPVVAEAPAA